MTGNAVRSHDYVVALDYSQFYLFSGRDEEWEHPTASAEAAILGDRIAQGDDASLVVVSPHQNNFSMALRVEQWESAPPDDREAWQEVFSATMRVAEDKIAYSSPTLWSVDLEAPSGLQELRITGRGFVNRGWPGSTEPGDEWRIQMWPATAPSPPRHLKAWAPA